MGISIPENIRTEVKIIFYSMLEHGDLPEGQEEEGGRQEEDESS